MGKGDRKTAKGKRYNSSYGNARSHDVKAVVVAGAAKKSATATKAAIKKTVTKKVAAKD